MKNGNESKNGRKTCEQCELCTSVSYEQMLLKITHSHQQQPIKHNVVFL